MDKIDISVYDLTWTVSEWANALAATQEQLELTEQELGIYQSRAERLETLLVKGQRDRHGDFHPLVPFEECKRGDCCEVLAALAPADGED